MNRKGELLHEIAGWSDADWEEVIAHSPVLEQRLRRAMSGQGAGSDQATYADLVDTLRDMQAAHDKGHDLPLGTLRQALHSVDAKAMNPLDQLEGGQLEALSRFRDEAGTRWKSKLLAGWLRASHPGHLQAIRNQLGPEWLATVKDDHFRQAQMRVDSKPNHPKDTGQAPRPRM
ncbi:hypothetical protein CBM2633_U10128 [Cupriavidus taiwanensis]|uniref:hypothetical protein n=1 Tax=Cupriavidus taiwanensis TaxID=164546 RepID=UPI000E1A9820|nr:hypothetical protein [Cupriavidus taiwanensis]SPA23784.1 hypothetical protein CBM2633_U10128 [Cupriavidus taiwanensis]